MLRLSEQFTQDFDIMTIVTSELKLATMLELQTVYSTSDMYDLLEIMQAQSAMTQYHEKLEEARRAAQQNR